MAANETTQAFSSLYPLAFDLCEGRDHTHLGLASEAEA